MTRSKSLYLAAAPVLILFALAAGGRFLPALLEQNGDMVDKLLGRLDCSASAPLTAADPQTQKALEAAVSGQIDALHKGDYQHALSYAATDFRETFTPARFREMILIGYRPLTDSVKTTFEGARVSDSMAMVTAHLRDKNGVTNSYNYSLIKEANGWHIVGCGPIMPFRPRPEIQSRDLHEI